MRNKLLINRYLLPLLAALSSAPLLADDASPIRWSDKTQGNGTPLQGTAFYFDPERVNKDGDVVTVSVYRSARLQETEAAGKYFINCATRELAFQDEKGKLTPPEKVLQGEKMYPAGKKLCDWDRIGFIRSIFD